VYYAKKYSHAEMLSATGTRELIVNVILGQTVLNIGANIVPRQGVLADPGNCEINGKKIDILSPVDIEVFDQSGNRLGKAPDGSLENNIAGADINVFGDKKFVYLPTDSGEVYNIKLKGEAEGSFTLNVQNIAGGQEGGTDVFPNLPVSPKLLGNLSLGVNSSILKLDNNGDGVVDQTLNPVAVLDANQSQDLLPPVSTSTLVGTLGAPGMYRSKIQITLKAEDVVVPGHEAETSGLLNLKFRLDNASSAPYSTYTGPISLESEGKHTLEFYATDKAGNNETPQAITFTIDKTAPELVMQFDQNLKDLSFTAKDNLSLGDKISLTDQDNTVTAIDEAGNKTVLTLKDKNRKNLMKAEIKSLSYNGQSQDISRNKLNFAWAFDKKKNLELLSQNVQSKKNFNILAIFDGKKTSLVGRDSSGIIFKSLKGLVLLKISTNKGDLVWSY
jgi:hypothetical protein